MLCPNCGRDVPETRDSCPYCLKKLQKPTMQTVPAKSVIKSTNSYIPPKNEQSDVFKEVVLGEGGWLKVFKAFKLLPLFSGALIMLTCAIFAFLCFYGEMYGEGFLLLISSPVLGLLVWALEKICLSPIVIFIESIAKMAKYED